MIILSVRIFKKNELGGRVMIIVWTGLASIILKYMTTISNASPIWERVDLTNQIKRIGVYAFVLNDLLG